MSAEIEEKRGGWLAGVWKTPPFGRWQSEDLPGLSGRVRECTGAWIVARTGRPSITALPRPRSRHSSWARKVRCMPVQAPEFLRPKMMARTGCRSTREWERPANHWALYINTNGQYTEERHPRAYRNEVRRDRAQIVFRRG